MTDSPAYSILSLPLRHERHVVRARQRAREIAAALGYERQEQVRLATATSELARNAYRYAQNGVVEFILTGHSPQSLAVVVTDSGPGIPNLGDIMEGRYVSKTGMGKGLIGTRRLMEGFEIVSSASGTRVAVSKPLPGSAILGQKDVRQLATQVSNGAVSDPFDELEQQNRELLKALADLREQQETLLQLNHELEDTNRGVLALYAELDQQAGDLRRISGLKTKFLSHLSHEFRTPLHSISSLCHMLLSRADGELTAEQAKQAGFIQKSATGLTEMVDDLLDLAKVEAGKIEVRSARFEVGEMFGALRGMLRPLAAGSDVDLIIEVEAREEIPSLYTDEKKLSQILRNLISNALKFTQHGEVRVTARMESDQMIAFRVSDTGIGIAQEDQARIFDEFTQIEGELQSRTKGTGLGLPLSRQLAELLGGSLELESQPGSGAVFTIVIPVIFDKREAGMKALSADDQRAAVLFIEDNPETSFLHESAVKNSDYRLLFAKDLDEARHFLQRITPAVVVLDRLINGEDCLSFVQEIHSRYRSCPVLVVSILDEQEAALEAGAAVFLAKPVAPFALAGAIRELIEGRPLKRILLVDDDEVTRYLVGNALIKNGCRVLEARNGRDAIDLAKQQPPDAIFLDILMPGLDGFEVLRELRMTPSTEAIPVIVHTSKNLNSREVELIRESNAMIFPKPNFDRAKPAQLMEVLMEAGINP